MNEDVEVVGQIIVNIPADPALPMFATIEGDVKHKHLLASDRVVRKAFRDYMSRVRTTIRKDIENGE